VARTRCVRWCPVRPPTPNAPMLYCISGCVGLMLATAAAHRILAMTPRQPLIPPRPGATPVARLTPIRTRGATVARTLVGPAPEHQPQPRTLRAARAVQEAQS